MSEPQYTLVSGLVEQTTDKAVLVKLEEGESTWIPRSVCEDGDSIEEDDEELHVATWWLRKNDIDV
jgi:hypothetical protein